MSWDLFVQDIPADAATTSDIPDDFAPEPIGPREEIIAGIRAAVPGADVSDPSWIRIEGPDYSLEVNLGDDATCRGFALHVRGGDAAACVVHEILEQLGRRAFDPASASGLFSLPDAARESLPRWRAYRDQVLRGEPQ